LGFNCHPGTVIEHYSWHKKFLSTPMAALFFRFFFSLGGQNRRDLVREDPRPGHGQLESHHGTTLFQRFTSFILSWVVKNSITTWDTTNFPAPLFAYLWWRTRSWVKTVYNDDCGLACILGLISPKNKISLNSSERSASSEWCSPEFEDWSFCISLRRKTDSVPQDKKLPRPLPTYLFSDP